MPNFGNQDRNGARRDNGERNRDDEMRSRHASQYGGQRADQMDDERGIGRDDRERYARDRHERDRDDERWRPDDGRFQAQGQDRNRGRDDWREPQMERERYGRERNELDQGDRNMGGRDDWRQAQRGSYQPSRDYRGETSRDREGNGGFDRGMSGMSGRDMYWNNMSREQGQGQGQGQGRDQQGQQQRAVGFRGKGPSGYQRGDERIKEDVCEALTEDDAVDASNIEIQVKQGEVTLTGTVPERHMKRCAEECIERLSGVKDVQNQLRVQASGDDTSRGKSARETESGQQNKSATTEKIKH